MRIWIVNHYADPPDGLATRSFDIGRRFVEKGHPTTIFACSFSHYHFQPARRLGWRLWMREDIEGVLYVWINAPGYRGNDWRRVLNMLVFSVLAFLAGVLRRERPEVVIGVSVHPLAALTGLFLACLGLDIHVHDTYFVVAHFHYIMVGGAVMGYIGGLHFWWPKITGRLYPESLARIAAITLFVGFNLTFFPQFILGYMGMPRRYHTYPPEFQVLNVLSTAGASILALGYLLPMIYLTWSMRYGKVAGPNPWPATGLEWKAASPPPTENFDVTPEVTWEPYDYNSRPDLGLTAGAPSPAPAHGDD